jgi:hypothetical protein
MADVWVLLLIAAFFAVCVALVRGCDLIIGAGETDALETSEPAAAGTRDTETVGAAG